MQNGRAHVLSLKTGQCMRSFIVCYSAAGELRDSPSEISASSIITVDEATVTRVGTYMGMLERRRAYTYC